MKYTIQIHTGSVQKQDYTLEEILSKLNYLTSKIDIECAIVGWYDNHELNEGIVNYLHAKNIKVLFWLPVFAEMIDLKKEDPFISYSYQSNDSNLYSNDKFQFVCLSSSKNIEYILSKYESITNGINFDGIFLDRIRYQSDAFMKGALYGCQCENCKKKYKDINLSSITSFKPISYHNGIYKYEDNNANKLMKVKRDVITNKVKQISSYCKKNNLYLGIDSFALSISDLVGQDLYELSKIVDMIKPMHYLKTTAPAGIPFEIDNLSIDVKEGIKTIWNNKKQSIEASVKMAKEMLKLPCKVSIGIDCNNIEGVCSSTTDYVLEHINALKEININNFVLSWDALKLSNDLIEKLNKLK